MRCFENLALNMADMAAAPGGGGGEAAAAAAEAAAAAAEAERHHDVRVNVKSKRIVTDQLAKYKSLFGKLLERQPELNQSDVQKMVEEMMLNFEIAVQENISVGGLSWKEAAEENSEEYECSTVDDLLDDKIVQTSWKRSVYPKKILPYFVRSLKAERKLMGLFESTVKPQEVKRDPVQDAIMSNVSATAPRMFKQAATVVKSLSQVRQRAEGLHQVLITRPSAETLEAYRDVFSGSDGKHCEVQCSSEFALRHSIRRAASEREYSLQYASVSPHNTHQ